MHLQKRVRLAVILFCGMILVCCSTMDPLFGPDFNVFSPSSSEQAYRLPPQHAYAGEVLAYMMQVVLGRAGEASMQNAWRERGLNVELRLKTVDDLLWDRGGDKRAVMVLDANVLALSKVMYTYDPRLNQFKGQLPFHSPYPSTELVALRLLLLKKQHAGEKIRIGQIMAREELLSDTGRKPSAADCSAMNLSPCEVRLLQDAFASEPQLKAYLSHPFLLKALVQMGIVEEDQAAIRLMRTADYRDVASARPKASGIKIAMLPSFIETFHFGDDMKGKTRFGFVADEEYLEVVNDFQKRLESAIATAVRKTGGNGAEAERVVFCRLDDRPLAVYPENAEEVIQGVCPDAAVTVIFLGNDVYRSFKNGAHVLGRLENNRIFLDILDVKYHMVEDEIRQIAGRIAERMKAR